MFPTIVRIGSYSLPSYGVLVALAFLAALWLTARLAKKQSQKSQFAGPRDSEKIVNLGVYCALAGMLGAKLLMIALDPDLRGHLSAIFSLETLQSAGIFYGGLIGALIFAFLYMRAQSLPVLATSDLFAPGLALGHAIGRVGCFAAGCCWGRASHLPWAVKFTNTDASTGVPLNIPLHPTQLYEALAEAVICLFLIWRIKANHRDGQIIGWYFLLSGLARFGVEFLRMHDASNPLGGPFTLEQWIALAVAIAGVDLIVRRGATPAALATA